MAFLRSRRQVVAALCVAGATPLLESRTPRAQQPPRLVIGWLNALSPSTIPALVASFRQELEAAGYVEGQNVDVDYRWADGRYEQLPAMAMALARRQVTVIFAVSPPAIRAAKAASTTIPIVFVSGLDPVKAGFVRSLSSPGGNVTGVSLITSALSAKRLEFLLALVPTASRIAVLLNRSNPNSDIQLADIEIIARAGERQFHFLEASAVADIDAAFATAAEKRCEALMVGADPFFTSRRHQIVALAARHAIPAIYDWQEYALAGGLMSYGTSLSAGYRQAANYVSRILRGNLPGELPVVQLSSFELTINLATARSLGLSVPRVLLARADLIIE